MTETNCVIEGDFKTLLIELKKDSHKALALSASRGLNLHYNEFKDYEERLSYNHGILLNTFGDSAGVSYFRLRAEYKKKKEKLNLPPLTDSEPVDEALSSCLKSRNYAHHFSEPKLLAWRKFREEQIKAYPYVTWPPCDIEITRCDITNIVFLLEIFDFFNHYYDLFSALQFCVRNDYCILKTGTSCKGDIKFNTLNKIDDYSALVISEQGSSLYSE